MSSSDEVIKAQQGAADAAAIININNNIDDGPPTVFDKILSGEWSSTKVYEDEECLAFRDIQPQAPVHILVIPKHRNGLTQLSRALTEQHKSTLGHLLYVAQQVGKAECPEGFRVVINDGVHGAQSVYHLHIHVLGGRQMEWPPG
jgi:histidine triad (HIT) family protein